MNQQNTSMVGITLGLLSCFGYALMDTFSKISLSFLNIPFVSYYFLVNCIALSMLSIFILYKYFFTKTKVNLLKFKTYYIFAAVVCSVGSFLSAFLALHDISLDIFYSILFTSPIFSTVFSYFLLGEIINKRKVLTLILGFTGIMIVVNPLNIQANNISFISVLLSFNVVIFDVSLGIITRKYLQKENPVTVRYYTFLVATLLAILILCFLSKNNIFHNINFKGYATTFSASLCMLVASLLLLKAYQYAPASIVGSTYYSFMIWAIIIGVFLFNNIPTLSTLLGCALIIMSNSLSYFNKKALLDKKV